MLKDKSFFNTTSNTMMTIVKILSLLMWAPMIQKTFLIRCLFVRLILTLLVYLKLNQTIVTMKHKRSPSGWRKLGPGNSQRESRTLFRKVIILTKSLNRLKITHWRQLGNMSRTKWKRSRRD